MTDVSGKRNQREVPPAENVTHSVRVRSLYLDVLSSMAAGAMAGAVAKTTIAPLDRTKIIFQTTEIQFTIKNVVKVISNTVQQHGVVALWRGNSATMARIVPYASIQFAAFEQLKMILDPEKRHGTAIITRFVCGSLAGVIAAFCTYPLDLVRARMAVTQRGRYTGLLDAIRKIYLEEGVRQFYRGFVPTMLGIVPYAGLSFLTYETCKSSYRKMNDMEPNWMHRMAFGACAGCVGQSTTYPLDIVRRRMQTDGVHGKSNPEYRTIYGTAKSIFRQEGLVSGLYKGLSMNWLKGPIAVGISFTTYDFFHDFFQSLRT